MGPPFPLRIPKNIWSESVTRSVDLHTIIYERVYKKMKKIIALLLALLMLAALLAGCGKKPNEESQPETSQSEQSQAEASQPEESQPEESQPEESQPEESQTEESQTETSEEPVSADPVVFDWTKADTSSLTLPNLGACWSGLKRGSSEFDETEGAWKITVTKAMGGMYGGYTNISLDPAVDMTTYKYIVVCYKTALGENDTLRLRRFGNVWADDVIPASSEFTTVIFETEDFDIDAANHQWESLGFTIINEVTTEEDTEEGAAFWVKYAAFFTNKADAEAFTIAG